MTARITRAHRIVKCSFYFQTQSRRCIQLSSMMADNEKYVPKWQTFTPKNQVKEPIKLKVHGNIPKWVKGSLYRNGAGVYQVGSSSLKHVFDGFAVLLRFTIENGEVMFQSRILESDSWEESYKAKRLVSSQFGTVAVPDPCKSIFSRIFSIFKPEEAGDNTSVNIVERGDQLWALTETTPINQIDPHTLARVGKKDVAKYVNVHLATAHPHFDSDGCMYNLATSFDPKVAYSIIKIPPKQDSGNLDFDNSSMVASVPSRWKWNISYNHSFGMSENYFVILEQPYVFSIFRLIFRKFWNSSIQECFQSYPAETTLFHVIGKNGEKVNITYKANAFFCFHFSNCYEEDGHLVVDLVLYKNVNAVDTLYLKDLQSDTVFFLDSSPVFARFVIPLDVSDAEIGKNLVTIDSKSTAVMQEDGSILCEPDYFSKDGIIMELPQINYKVSHAQKNRYVYASTIFTKENKIVKLNLESRTTNEYIGPETSLPGEPVFLAKPNAETEDDGVLLAPFMANEPGLESYLAIIDAKTMKEIALAVLPAEEIMTLTFHGFFKATET